MNAPGVTWFRAAQHETSDTYLLGLSDIYETPYQQAFAALLACAASAGAMAQATPSFKITVSGTITGSCKPESGDLTFDMKNINPKSLNNDKMTQLPMILQK